MTFLTLLQSQAEEPPVVVTEEPPATQRGGGWDAREFARLRRQLARRKRKLKEEVREIIAGATAVAAGHDPGDAEAADIVASLVAPVRAQLAQIGRAATAQALADIERELAALRARIEDELEDEETLLLLAA